MAIRKFIVEVVRTSEVEVWLDDSHFDSDMIVEWERSLWEIPDGLQDIAEYIAVWPPARSVVSNDGLGETRSYNSLEKNMVLAGYHWNETMSDIECSTKEII